MRLDGALWDLRSDNAFLKMGPRHNQFLWCCQTKSNRSQSTTITQIYEAQI